MCVQCRERKVSALASLVHYQLSIISHQSRVEHPHRLLTSFSSSWMCVLVLYVSGTGTVQQSRIRTMGQKLSLSTPCHERRSQILLTLLEPRMILQRYTSEFNFDIWDGLLRYVFHNNYRTTTVPGAILVSACDMWDMCLRTWASENPVHYVA